MNKDMVIIKLREDLNILEEEYEVEKLGLFGSYALESNTEESDIDIFVKLKKTIGFKFLSHF